MQRPEPRIPIPDADIARVCRRFQVARLSLFGSVLRDDFTDDSDVDILVEFMPDARPSYFTLAQLEDALSALLGGRDVQVVTFGALHPRIRDKVLDSAQPRYAA